MLLLGSEGREEEEEEVGRVGGSIRERERCRPSWESGEVQFEGGRENGTRTLWSFSSRTLVVQAAVDTEIAKSGLHFGLKSPK